MCQVSAHTHIEYACGFVVCTDGVKFFSKSRWITVVVDDRFPCILKNGIWVPVFCRPSDSAQNSDSELELWCMIVEKAWAKLHGYANIVQTPPWLAEVVYTLWLR